MLKFFPACFPSAFPIWNSRHVLTHTGRWVGGEWMGHCSSTGPYGSEFLPYLQANRLADHPPCRGHKFPGSEAKVYDYQPSRQPEHPVWAVSLPHFRTPQRPGRLVGAAIRFHHSWESSEGILVFIMGFQQTWWTLLWRKTLDLLDRNKPALALEGDAVHIFQGLLPPSLARCPEKRLFESLWGRVGQCPVFGTSRRSQCPLCLQGPSLRLTRHSPLQRHNLGTWGHTYLRWWPRTAEAECPNKVAWEGSSLLSQFWDKSPGSRVPQGSPPSETPRGPSQPCLDPAFCWQSLGFLGLWMDVSLWSLLSSSWPSASGLFLSPSRYACLPLCPNFPCDKDTRHID
jgi:hypothetical protein